MSEIYLPDMVHSQFIKIGAARVYDLDESIAASKYPMSVNPDPKNDELTATAVKLAQCEPCTGHDNWLCGVRVSFDMNMTPKMMVEWERYSFQDPVSSTSSMHRITKFDLDKSYCEYVDPRMIAVMKELVCQYNEDPTPENYLKVLYSNPSGFIYRLRLSTNYRQLKTMYIQRKNHKLPEWKEFTRWIESLPHSELITGPRREAV